MVVIVQVIHMVVPAVVVIMAAAVQVRLLQSLIVPVAAALENIKILEEEDLVGNAARLGEILQAGIARIRAKYPEHLTWCGGKGLVAGIRCTKGDKQPDPETSRKINLQCLYRGLLMFAPVGTGGECVKIAPPLCITEDALLESLQVLEEACDAVFTGKDYYC